MDHAEALTRSLFPGIFTYSVKIKNDTIPDSIFVSFPEQVELMAAELAGIPELAGGFNLMGVSQGGANIRGYIEEFSGKVEGSVVYPKVNAAIGWVSVMAGVSGVPMLGSGPINDLVTHLLTTIPYDSEIQKHVAPATYWRDPFELETFVKKCVYLPVLDNNPDAMSPPDPARKERFSSLAHLVLLYSEVDKVLIPKETGWFGTFAPGSYSHVVPVNQTAFWTDDWIGLRALDESGKVTWGTTMCEHQDYSSPCFDKYFTQYVVPVLKQPLAV